MRYDIHDKTEDGSWFWLVEKENGDKTEWEFIAKGYATSQEEALLAVQSYVAIADQTYLELDASKTFGKSLVQAFERQMMDGGINDNLAMASEVDSVLEGVSSALERGRLHIALHRLAEIMTVPEENREGMPFTSNGTIIYIYNQIADFIGKPRLT